MRKRSIILASASIERQKILERLSIPFIVIPSSVDESVEAGLSPEEIPAVLAKRKALSVAGRRSVAGKNTLVLGADTLVILDGAVLGKPRDEAEARNFLEKLSGKSHKVVTALCVVNIKSGAVSCDSASTIVEVAPITGAQIDWYIATGEWKGAAGGYRAQGLGARFLVSMTGLESTVAGLPIYQLFKLLCADT